MPSLDKVKPGTRELLAFIDSTSAVKKDIVYSLKLDGVSGMILYKDGHPDKIYTRGDGSIGGDVSYLKKYVKGIPGSLSNHKNIVVRGEFIIPKDVWSKRYSDTYSNPRSFVSAKVNSGHVTQGMEDIEFLAYEIVDDPPKVDSKFRLDGVHPMPDVVTSFDILSTLGFIMPDHGILKSDLVFDIMNLYKAKRSESAYGIDGLVLSINIGPGIIKRRSVAFKMKLEEQVRDSKITNVEWNISRYGRLVPVAIYESVYIDGVRLHRASAFNAAHVKDWRLGKGTHIKVLRSGDVIPTILDVTVDDSIQPIYPPLVILGSLGTDKGWRWKGSDIVLNDIESNRIVHLKRMEHFFTVIGVPRLREKTLEKMWDVGLKNIKAITLAKSSDFQKIKGIGKKSADDLYKNIHTTMRNTRIDRYIPASSMLGSGFGRKLIKQIFNYHPTLLEDDPATLKIILTKKNIPGIGPKRIDNIVENITKFKSFIYSLGKEDIDYAITQDIKRREMIKNRGYNEKIKGKTFVLTGFFGKIDYELEDYIYDNFGSFSNNVVAGVEAVITANLMDVTSKMLNAQKYNIPVLSIEEFVKAYNIPYSKANISEEGADPNNIPIDVDDDDMT